MAEIVEYRVERTLDEVNLLVEFGIFDKEYAKEILAKRQQFEYALRRRTKNKLDSLKYIKFEINLLESIEKYKRTVLKNHFKESSEDSLEKLDEIERKILLLQAKKLNDIIRSRSAHVSSLFRKLATKYQFDTKLWLAYIEFAKNRKWNTRVSALYWRLLRVAGNDESIWVQAAEHEIEVNKAYDTARGLYLRALRHHPKSWNLWSKYFIMEMKFMDIVAQRARIVFRVTTDTSSEAMTDDNSRSNNNSSHDIWADTAENINELEDADMTAEKSLDGENRVPEVKSIDENDDIINGKLPKIVYDNASKSIEIITGFSSFIVIILNYIYNISEKSKGSISVEEYILEDLKQNGESKICSELLSKCKDQKSLQEYVQETESSSRSKRAKTHECTKMDLLYESYETKGIDATRSLFEKSEKFIKNQTLSLYVGMIQVELWELKKYPNDQDIFKRIRSIYDKALLKFGKEKPKLWYEYIQFEHNNSKSLDDFDRVNQLYSRAQKTLDPSKVDRLIEKYTLIHVNSSNAELEYSDYSDLEEN